MTVWLVAAVVGIAISVRPAVLQKDQSLWLTCRVPPRFESRVLEMGLEGYQTSTRQLDGLMAPITWQTQFKHVPCGPDTAFCAVTFDSGARSIVRTNILVAGCN